MSYQLYMFQFTLGMILRIIILVLILRYFIKEFIKNRKDAKFKPVKKKDDIQKRLKKANKAFLKK